MRTFDLRHRWGPVTREGSVIIRTCRACGRTDRAETIIPDAVVADILRHITAVSPFRTLVR